jgi:hypothetical protein
VVQVTPVLEVPVTETTIGLKVPFTANDCAPVGLAGWRRPSADGLLLSVCDFPEGLLLVTKLQRAYNFRPRADLQAALRSSRVGGFTFCRMRQSWRWTDWGE